MSMNLSKKRYAAIAKNLNIHLSGDETTNFYAKKSGMLLATGYVRVVIGERGPYIEFADKHMHKQNLFMPAQKHVYFDEWSSKCPDRVFVYHQRQTVAYADYRIGSWYIAPDLLKTDKCEICIGDKKQKVNAVF